MGPALTLRIPFTLLGRQDLFRPSDDPTIRPLTDLSKAFEQLCPQVKVHLQLTPHDPPRDAPPTWHLSPSPGSGLNIDERLKVPDSVWHSSMVLIRPGLGLEDGESAWRTFKHEVQALMEVLHILNTYHGETHSTASKVRLYAVAISSTANLHVSLSSTTTSTLDTTLISNIFVVFTALERELSLLSTPSNLLRYWPLSRVLESLCIQRLAKEKNDLWKNLAQREDWSARRKADGYARRKKKWIAGFDDEDDGVQRLKGREREWFDVLDVDDVLKFKMDMCVQATFDDEGKVNALLFPSYPSTTDPGNILAYTKLLTALIALANDFTAANLITWVESFRERVSSGLTPTTPIPNPSYGFTHLLSVLHISPSSREHFSSYLQDPYPSSSLATATITTHPYPLGLSPSPFDPLTTYLQSQHSTQKEYIPTFIARYTSAGGFQPTPTKKLYALMVAEEHVHRKRTVAAPGMVGVRGGSDGRERREEGREEWMSSVKDNVRVSDAIELEGI